MFVLLDHTPFSVNFPRARDSGCTFWNDTPKPERMLRGISASNRTLSNDWNRRGPVSNRQHYRRVPQGPRIQGTQF